MKALSLWQPWASAIPMGLKHYETRSWSTTYRGPLVIAAAKTMKGVGTLSPCMRGDMERLMRRTSLMDLPTGVALCVCDLVDVIDSHDHPNTEISEIEHLFGDWSPNRYAWKLDQIRPITITIPIKGKQGLFNCPQDVADYCEGLRKGAPA